MVSCVKVWLCGSKAVPLLCGGVEDIDYSQYPGVELQRDWLTAYLESYKHSSGLEVRVTEAEVTRLHLQVCKFSLVGFLLIVIRTR